METRGKICPDVFTGVRVTVVFPVEAERHQKETMVSVLFDAARKFPALVHPRLSVSKLEIFFHERSKSTKPAERFCPHC